MYGETITTLNILHNHTSTWALDELCVHIFNKRQVPVLNAMSDNATRFISQFQRTDFHLNGY